MNHRIHHAAVLVVSLLGFAAQVAAQDVSSNAQPHALGQHPAILVQQQTLGIDANRFIVAHPAQLAVIATPSPTYAHPAVAVARMARESSDVGRYIDQPPVAGAWLRRSQPTASATGAAVLN